MRLFGLEINGKTDGLAFVAFVLSTVGIVYHFIGFLKGPEIEMFGPKQVRLIATDSISDTDSEIYFSVVATLSYTNKGQPQNNGVVFEEHVEFKMDRTYKFYWHEFVTTTPGIGGKIEITDRSTSHAFVVPAGGSVAHETSFSPRPDYGYLKLSELNRYYKDDMMSVNKNIKWKPIEFTFYSQTLKDGKRDASCTAILNRKYFKQLTNKETYSTALSCLMSSS